MQQKQFLALIIGLAGALGLANLYSCNKKDGITETPPVTDYDNNVYKTVKIGNQVWMAQPLRVTHYNDGTPIPYVDKGNIWNTTTTGARCYYGTKTGDAVISISDSGKYAIPYGALYNLAAVSSNKLAPKGYHVPDTSDFNILINYAGGSDIAGQFLKSKLYWKEDNGIDQPDRNKTGFTALPGGMRTPTTFIDFGAFAYFWSSTKTSDTTMMYYPLSRDGMIYSNPFGSQKTGFSVVCVKNKE